MDGNLAMANKLETRMESDVDLDKMVRDHRASMKEMLKLSVSTVMLVKSLNIDSDGK